MPALFQLSERQSHASQWRHVARLFLDAAPTKVQESLFHSRVVQAACWQPLRQVVCMGRVPKQRLHGNRIEAKTLLCVHTSSHFDFPVVIVVGSIEWPWIQPERSGEETRLILLRTARAGVLCNGCAAAAGHAAASAARGRREIRLT